MSYFATNFCKSFAMKKLYILIFFAFTFMRVQAQWTIDTTTFDMTGSNISISSVFFTDANHGWATAGYELLTYSYGTWTNQYFSTIPFKEVEFLDNSNGWGFGMTGTIVKTTNGGVNWTPETASGSSNLVGSMLSTTEGYAIDNFGKFYTYNGSAWTLHSTFGAVTDFQFTGSNYGWATGDNLFRFNGSAWNPISAGVGNYSTYALTFLNDTLGWICGYSFDSTKTFISKYSNGNWTNYPFSYGQNAFNAMHAPSATNCWAVGNAGLIWHWDGINWTLEVPGTGDDILDVFFVNDSLGWAVTSGGKILRYGNAPSGINEYELSENFFSLFPNPATNHLNISLSKNIEIQNISIINGIGETIMNMDGFYQSIDVSTLSSGIYFVQLIAENRLYSKKFLIQE
jgi:photosystem II stability/assembly factor-like uncharacterized protein